MPAPDSPKGLGFISSALSAPVSPAEAALRPLSFADFTGQLKTVERLQVTLDGADRDRHVLLCNGFPVPLRATGISGRRRGVDGVAIVQRHVARPRPEVRAGQRAATARVVRVEGRVAR
ncbi:MAG: transglutaminase family protein, partial [Opitutales bacterium]|nr:transglutaminase family protein [Opitutales bacterium]